MLISIGEVFRNGREKRKRCLKMTATIIDVFIETELNTSRRKIEFAIYN